MRFLVTIGDNLKFCDGTGQTLLHFACNFTGSADFVRGLVAAGVDPNMQDRYGRTALHIAIGTDVVKIIDRVRNGEMSLFTSGLMKELLENSSRLAQIFLPETMRVERLSMSLLWLMPRSWVG